MSVIGQMVVDPPGDGFPVAGAFVIGDEAVDDDAGGGAHAAVGVAPVPDMAGIIALVAAAIELVLIAEVVDRGRAVGASGSRCGRSGPAAVPAGFRRGILPAAMARSGSSGILGRPLMTAISENRKSRMKKLSDRRTRPRVSRALTLVGFRTARFSRLRSGQCRAISGTATTRFSHRSIQDTPCSPSSSMSPSQPRR